MEIGYQLTCQSAIDSYYLSIYVYNISSIFTLCLCCVFPTDSNFPIRQVQESVLCNPIRLPCDAIFNLLFLRFVLLTLESLLSVQLPAIYRATHSHHGRTPLPPPF